MNTPVFIASLVSFLALGAHIFIGTQETASISPDRTDKKRLANWVQAMCAFQMLSVDMLVIASLLLVVAISDLGKAEDVILLFAIALYALWGIVWLVQMTWLKQHDVSIFQLPQWLIWFFCVILLSWGYVLQPL